MYMKTGKSRERKFTAAEVRASKNFLNDALTRTRDRSLQSMDHFWFLYEAKRTEVWRALTYEKTMVNGEAKRIPFRSFEHMLGKYRLCGITPARFRKVEFMVLANFLDKQQMRYLGVEALAKIQPLLKGHPDLYRKDKFSEKHDHDLTMKAYRALASWRGSQEDRRIVIYDQTATRILRHALKLPTERRKDWKSIAEKERATNAKLNAKITVLEKSLRDIRLEKALKSKPAKQQTNGVAHARA
jgi:hypothetical protein